MSDKRPAIPHAGTAAATAAAAVASASHDEYGGTSAHSDKRARVAAAAGAAAGAGAGGAAAAAGAAAAPIAPQQLLPYMQVQRQAENDDEDEQKQQQQEDDDDYEQKQLQSPAVADPTTNTNTSDATTTAAEEDEDAAALVTAAERDYADWDVCEDNYETDSDSDGDGDGDGDDEDEDDATGSEDDDDDDASNDEDEEENDDAVPAGTPLTAAPAALVNSSGYDIGLGPPPAAPAAVDGDSSSSVVGPPPSDTSLRALVRACRDGDYALTDAMLRHADAGAGAGAGAGTAAYWARANRSLSGRRSPLFAAVWSADDARLVQLLVSRGANVNARFTFNRSLLHVAKSAAVVRALLAAGCKYANTRDGEGNTPLHAWYRTLLSAALRVLVERGGADVWSDATAGDGDEEDEDGAYDDDDGDESAILPVHLQTDDVAATETLLALMVRARGDPASPADAAACTRALQAALGIRTTAGGGVISVRQNRVSDSQQIVVAPPPAAGFAPMGTVLHFGRCCPRTAATLLARGADPFPPGALHVIARQAAENTGQGVAALQVLLAHGAAVLGSAGAGAGVLVQHARDSPHFTRRVARWDAVRRARIAAGAKRTAERWREEDKDDEEDEEDIAASNEGSDDDAQQQQQQQRAGKEEENNELRRQLLLEESQHRQLAALAEDHEAWAWARGQLDAVPLPAAAAPLVPATTEGGETRRPLTLRGWLRARDHEGQTPMERMIRGGAPVHWAPALRLLLRYGAPLERPVMVIVLQRRPRALWDALSGGDALPAAPCREDVAEAAAMALRETTATGETRSEHLPDPKAILAAFDECVKVRVKRISAGLQHVVPLPYRRGYQCPLDIVSGYIGFAMHLD